MKAASTAIIVSSSDPVGLAIKGQLLKNYGFEKAGNESFGGFAVFSLPIEDNETRLYTIAADPVSCDSIDKQIPAELFIFATKHFSQAAVPALTTHAIGNWAKAECGGRDGIVCKSPSQVIKLFLQNLNAVAKSESYAGEVVQEATHHGPYLEKPAAFIEVGSSEKEWKDEKMAAMVADSLIGGLGDLAALEENGENYESAVALGGPHYAENFRKLMLDSKYAVGHICPKHHLGSLNAGLLQQALDACVPKASMVALDWKGLGEWKQKVREILEASGTEYFRA